MKIVKFSFKKHINLDLVDNVLTFISLFLTGVVTKFLSEHSMLIDFSEFLDVSIRMVAAIIWALLLIIIIATKEIRGYLFFKDSHSV